MAKKPKIILSKQVHRRLSRLLETMPEDTISDQLLDELDRAEIVADDKVPDDVVTIHSQVTFKVRSTGKTFTYTLVYPTELDDTERQLSVMSPVGSAIIGLQEGSEIDWVISPNRQTSICVEKVLPPQA